MISYATSAIPAAQPVRILHNTFVGPLIDDNYGAILAWNSNAGLNQQQNYLIRNNIFTGWTGAGNNGQQIITTFQPGGFDTDYNVFDADGTWRWNNGTERTALAQWQSDLGGCPGSGNNCNSAEGEPSFVGGGDYHLAAGDSVAQGRGVDVSAYTSEDFDGDMRPQNATWDVGADEVATAPPAPPKNVRIVR